MGSLIQPFKRRLIASLFLTGLIGMSQSGLSCAASQSFPPELSPSIPCPGPDVLDGQPDLSALSAIEKDLSRQAIEQACLASPDYLWLRGLIARQLGNFHGASIWFELSMLRQPDRAGVLLDFAITREALGDLLSAKTIYQSLLAEHNPPDALRALITARLSVVETSLRDQFGKSGIDYINPDTQSLRSTAERLLTRQTINYAQFGVSHGYDSNLNSASSLRALNLLIEDQVFSLEIPERDQPQPGRFQTVYSRLGRQGNFEDGRWGLNMRQSLRLTDNSRFRSGAFELGAEASYNLTNLGPFSGEIQGYFGKQWLGLDKAVVLQSDRLAISYELGRKLKVVEGECSLQLGLEGEYRRYPSRQVLDGDLLHRGVRLLCRGNDSRFELFSRLGKDRELDVLRAGGGQAKQEWGLVWIKEYSNQMIRLHRFSSNSIDETGYNQLIDNNKVREVARKNFGFEWVIRPAGSRVEPFLAYEKTAQHSTISIFSYRSWQVSGGLRWNF